MKTHLKFLSAMQTRNILVLLLSVVFIPLLLSQTYTYYSWFQDRKEAEMQANLEIARSVANSFEAFVDDVLRTELAIGMSTTAMTALSRSDLREILIRTAQDTPAIRSMTWFSPEGQPLVSSESEQGMDVSKTDYYSKIISGQESVVSELVISQTGEPVFGIYRVIRDSKGKFLGFMGVSVLPDKLDDAMAFARPKDSGISLLDSKGMHVFRWPKTDYTWEQRNWLGHYPVVAEVLAGKEAVTVQKSESSGKTRIVGWSPVSKYGWVSAASRAEEDVVAPIISAMLPQIIFLLVTLSLTVITALALARPMVISVRKLRDQALALGRGQIEDIDISSGPTEINELSSAFNQMSEEIRIRETALRGSVAKFEAALNSMTDAMIITDAEGNLIEINDAFATFHRFRTKDEYWKAFAKYSEIFEGFLPDGTLAPIDMWPVRRALRGEIGTNAELHVRRKDTGESWVGSYGFGPIRDQDGVIVGSVVVARDITERKRAEEKLRDSKERLQLALDAARFGTFDYHLPSGRIIWDDQMRHIWGMAAEVTPELSDVLERVYPEDRERVSHLFAEALRPDGNDYYEANYRIIWPDASVHWTSARGHVYFEGEGEHRRAVRVIGIEQDITDRNREEEKLAAAHRQIQSIIDNTPDLVYAFDLENRFIMANKAVAEVLNSTPEQLIGKRRHEFMSGEDADWHEANERRVIEAGKALEFEEYSQLDGRSITWLTKKFPLLHAQGKIYAVAGISADITERKQAEEALREAKASLEQKIRERTMHLQNLTEQLEKSRHELRKLASELVRAEERERKRIAGVLHDDIAQILASARMRLDMLHDIPSDQDKQTLTDAKALLFQSIRETRNLMSDIGNPLLFDMGLRLACQSLAKQMMERHPIRISCDIRDAYKHLNPDVKAILFQVVRELLNNVVKHSQARNAHVKLDMEDGNFRVDVSDDGVGFDPQTLGGPTIEGGFGLYSVRERLIAMDGSLKIESAPGAGTVATALLPAALE